MTKVLVGSLAGKAGEDGEDGQDAPAPQLSWRTSGGYLQVSVNGGAWTNAVQLSLITGAAGQDGDDGDPGAPGVPGDTGTAVDMGSFTGPISLSTLNFGDIGRMNMTGNVSFTALPTPPTGKVGTFSLRIMSNSFTITGWPANVIATDGSKPILTAGSTPDFIHFTWDGVTWWVTLGDANGS